MFWKGIPKLVKVPIYPMLSDSKNTFPHFLSNCWLFIWSNHWSLLLLVRNLPDQPVILQGALFNQVKIDKNSDYNLGIDFSNWKNLKEFFQWTDWSGQPVLTSVSFLSFRQSTEPVLVSNVSRQDPGSCSSPESLNDPGSNSSSDPCKLLQCSLQYSSVGHSSSGLTFPLWYHTIPHFINVADT